MVGSGPVGKELLMWSEVKMKLYQNTLMYVVCQIEWIGKWNKFHENGYLRQLRMRVWGFTMASVTSSSLTCSEVILPELYINEPQHQRTYLLTCIMKTCLYNFDPLKPHFYIVKLRFTGVYIIFLISAQNID